MNSSFVFVTCQPGAEKLVKRDVANKQPEWRFAFSRPGFLTFKAPVEVGADIERPTWFCRSFGISLGTFGSVEEALAQVEKSALVHAFVRDELAFDDPRNLAYERDAQLAEQVRGFGWTYVNQAAKHGELVWNVMEVDPGKYALGAFRMSSEHRGTPAGRPPQWETPTQAPSRVWGKVREALWRTGRRLDARGAVLDIGCAPGGGTHVLLESGAPVIGIDPAEMAEHIAAHPRFWHIRQAVESVETSQIPAGVEGCVYDVNLAPKMMLGPVSKFLATIPSLRWGFFTLKLNSEAALADVPWMLQRLEKAGFDEFFVEQLFFNRQELFCYATKKASSERRKNHG